MNLARGTRLGPYEIISFIGKGGMGEVYRAQDVRLDRTVAIKVLPEHRLFDEQIRQRFVREAKAIGALSHPHICHLNELGSHDGIDFLVMEHLEGETLADRLTRVQGRSGQALRIEEVLRHAIQIADALSEAHRQGMVHRDLKPGNVMITSSGIKLLDFGLAKFSPQAGGVAALSTIGAEPDSLTSEGAVLGSWQYMSPEQLQGREADVRSDIFAFGAVAYEMLTGRKAFEADSHAGIIAAILERDPPSISTLRPDVPAALDRVIRKSLAKDPDARWQTMRDLADELKWIASEHGQPAQHADLSTQSDSRPALWVLAAGLAAAALVLGGVTWSLARRESPSQPIRRFTIRAPAGTELVGLFAISPDGQQVVYRGRTGGTSHLYVRPLDQLEARALPGTEGGMTPNFSPDGQWVAFFADGKLKKVSLTSTGAPITLADLPNCCAGNGHNWLADDFIAVPLIATGVVRVPGQGGTPVPLLQVDTHNREIDHHSPVLLPDGRTLLFAVHRGAEAFDVVAQRLDGGAREILVEDAFEARYAPSGHLVFARNNAVLAAPFDAAGVRVTGPPVTVIEDVRSSPESGAANYQFSDDGSLVYARSPSLQGRRLAWIDRRGAIEYLPVSPRGFGAPSLSPDGRRVAFQVDDGSSRDVWIYEFATEAMARVTFDGASAAPIWTPDGQRIVYSSTKEGRRQIYWQPADGTGQAELLVADEHSVWPGSWSPDQRVLAFTRQPPTDQNDIALLRVAERTSTPLLNGGAQEQWPRISPDGRWLAYMSSESGRNEIYVTPLSGAGAKRQISIDGGGHPVWSRDGRELFFRSGGRFMVVSAASLPAGPGKPVALQVPVRPATISDPGYWGHPGYDVSRDGRLLIVEQAKEEAAPGEIQVVLNWFEELKRRVPTPHGR